MADNQTILIIHNNKKENTTTSLNGLVVYFFLTQLFTQFRERALEREPATASLTPSSVVVWLVIVS